MHSAFVSDENHRDQNKHHDENDALFAFGEFKNSKQPFIFCRNELDLLFRLRESLSVAANRNRIRRRRDLSGDGS